MSNLKDLLLKYKNKEIEKSEFIDAMQNQHIILKNYQERLCKIDLEKIEINKKEIIVRTKTGISMNWDVQDGRSITSEILNFGSYEPEELNMILRIIKPNDTVFDIGANTGWYSLNIAIAMKKTKIYAFEPIPHTYNFLINNINLNKLTNIKPCNFGFSDNNGELVFFFDPKITAATSLRNIYHNKNKIKIKASVIRMDDFVRKKKINKINFIKIDVEGAELLVLKGALETLSKYKPILFVEMLRKWSAEFDYHPNDIINMLSKIGYSCYKIQNSKLVEFYNMDENTKETNFFFLDSNTCKDKLSKNNKS